MDISGETRQCHRLQEFISKFSIRSQKSNKQFLLMSFGQQLYEKNIVINYVNHLDLHGDEMFAQFLSSIQSLNAMLYDKTTS